MLKSLAMVKEKSSVLPAVLKSPTMAAVLKSLPMALDEEKAVFFEQDGAVIRQSRSILWHSPAIACRCCHAPSCAFDVGYVASRAQHRLLHHEVWH